MSRDDDIPREGLREALRAWSGRGTLFELLADIVPEDPDLERTWTPEELRVRAHRVLFEYLLPDVTRLPRSFSKWLDAVPSEVLRSRVVTRAPDASTSWSETRRRGSWPPREFVGHQRKRVADQMLTTALAWTLRRLDEIRADAASLAPGIDDPVAEQLRVARLLADYGALFDAEPIRPSQHDLLMLRREGYPWSAVSSLATQIRFAEVEPARFAEELLIPDEGIRWRLFHLGVLGQVLLGARRAGAHVTATAPLTRAAVPAFRIEGRDGVEWEVWFEADTAWKFYGATSPYLSTTKSLGGSSRPLSPDVLVRGNDSVCYSIECKYSYDVDYIRQGVREAMAYSTDLSGTLAATVVSVVVVPGVSVAELGGGDTSSGRLALHTPSSLVRLLEQAFGPSAPESLG